MQHPCPRISSYLALQSSTPSVFPSSSPAIHFPKSSQNDLKNKFGGAFPHTLSIGIWGTMGGLLPAFLSTIWLLPVSLSLGALQLQWPSLDMPTCPCLWAFEFTVPLPERLCPHLYTAGPWFTILGSTEMSLFRDSFLHHPIICLLSIIPFILIFCIALTPVWFVYLSFPSYHNISSISQRTLEPCLSYWLLQHVEECLPQMGL